MSERTFIAEPFGIGVDRAKEIAQIHLAIRHWQVKIGQNTFRDILASQADLTALEDYYIAGGGNFFVAKDEEGNIGGFMGLRNDHEGHGVIKRLAVVPEHQRKGVGQALVCEAIEWARQNGFIKLSLHTNINENARPLYEKFGFKVTGFIQESQDWAMELDLAT